MQDNNDIDIIYIDPPYNTGNSTLGYRDLREQNEWLNFMKARLEKAYDLLSDNGIIFISIDDTMQAYLKIICDEVFGINRFVGNIIWNKQNFQYGAHNIQKNHEYVLVYSKSDISDKKVLFKIDSQKLVLRQDKRGTYIESIRLIHLLVVINLLTDQKWDMFFITIPKQIKKSFRIDMLMILKLSKKWC